MKYRSDSPFASKCGTLYLPLSVGMRLSLRGTHLRESSSVDQITWRTPAAVRACERTLETVFVIHIGRHHLGAEAGELLCLLGIGIARDGTHPEVALSVAQNGAHQSPTLRTGSADHGNDFLLGHK